MYELDQSDFMGDGDERYELLFDQVKISKSLSWGPWGRD